MAGDKTNKQLEEDIKRREKASGSSTVYGVVSLVAGIGGLLISAPLAPVALIGAGVFGYVADRNDKAAQRARDELSRRGADQPEDHTKDGRTHAYTKYASHNWVKDMNSSD